MLNDLNPILARLSNDAPGADTVDGAGDTAAAPPLLVFEDDDGGGAPFLDLMTY